MYLKLLALWIVLALVSCNGPSSATLTPEDSPSSVESEPSPGPVLVETQEIVTPRATDETITPGDDYPYPEIPSELCPPDLESVEDTPLFAEVLSLEVEYEGLQTWLQPGIFVNREGELFLIQVSGRNPEAVEQYTSELRICLDRIAPGDDAEVAARDISDLEVEPSEEPDTHPEDLLIEIFFIGFAPPESSVDELVRVLFSPSDQWLEQFRGLEIMLDQTRPEEVMQPYLLDLVIDPTVNNSAQHQYREKNATKVWVEVSVKHGVGSVQFSLCRPGLTPSTKSVTKQGIHTDHLSASTISTAQFDLGVKGASSGTYRVSGRFGYSGWSAAYLAAAPTGSIKSCP